MKKIFLFIIFYLIFNLNAFSFISPPKINKIIGGIIGKIQPQLITGDLSPDKINNIKMILLSPISDKQITVEADENGYYNLLNIEPGNYQILYFSFIYIKEFKNRDYYNQYTFPKIVPRLTNSENALPLNLFIDVFDKFITEVETININFILPRLYNQTYFIPDYYISIDKKNMNSIKIFREKDKQKKWINFEIFSNKF